VSLLRLLIAAGGWLDHCLLLRERDLLVAGRADLLTGFVALDGLALDTHLFTLHRDRLRHVLGDEVLPEPDPFAWLGPCADADVVLVGGRCACARSARAGRTRELVAGCSRIGCVCSGCLSRVTRGRSAAARLHRRGRPSRAR